MAPKRVIPEWTFGDRLRKVRVCYAGMTQVEFARMLGVGESQYTAWESDRNMPRPQLKANVARRIEELWGVPATWTLYDEVTKRKGPPPYRGEGPLLYA